MSDRTARPAVLWLRDDLRLADNPALAAAAGSGRPLVIAYVLDEKSPGLRALGGAARWWLSRSLADMEKRIAERGGTLILRTGAAGDVLPSLAKEIDADAVYWNRRYGAAEIAVDKQVKQILAGRGVRAESFNGSLLHEPWTVLNTSKQPFRVFTPFHRAAAALEPRAPGGTPAWRSFSGRLPSERLGDWGLEPASPNWAGGIAEAWTPGEDGARARIADFIDRGIRGYATLRDRPDVDHTSRLSPFLRFGNVSPNQVHTAVHHAMDSGKVSATDAGKMLTELYWREFSYHLLFHFPDLADVNFQSRFDRFPWRDDAAFLAAWKRGRTGYPIVDAGLRQLWETGWMHNRVRMITASFLIKHGLIDWRAGEAWFWDTLVDADPASNAASWQWVAGSGADAAPYFRIFNPMIQAAKFDPRGDYVRRFVPELAHLPDSAIHAPWLADEDVLRRAGVGLGETYPHPIVDHAAGRRRALDAFDSIK